MGQSRKGVFTPLSFKKGNTMLKIESVLKFIRDEITKNSERIVVIDDEHVFDNKTGIKLHIYDDWFKVTRNDDVIATMRDFDTSVEQPIVWEIKRLITKPEVMEQRKAEYMPMIKERRELLSQHFESPVPIESKIVMMESDTEDYTG